MKKRRRENRKEKITIKVKLIALAYKNKGLIGINMARELENFSPSTLHTKSFGSAIE